MAKPRIFISSTYYDLKRIRSGIENFISQLGYESVLFESGDIPFQHDKSLDLSCYQEVEGCHMFVLIIGGRYGSAATEQPEEKLSTKETENRFQFYNSITKKEYETAKKKDIPIYTFIDKGVLSEYETFKKNRDNETIDYAHVDNKLVFELIDEIYAESRNNFCRGFEDLKDITKWLTIQWAGIFASFLIHNQEKKNKINLEHQISTLQSTIDGLKTYTESIMINNKVENAKEIIAKTNKEITAEKEEKKFLSTFYVNHLIESHNVESNELKNVFKKSKTWEEFQSNIKEIKAIDKGCQYLRPFDDDDFAKINIVREVLKLKQYEKHES